MSRKQTNKPATPTTTQAVSVPPASIPAVDTIDPAVSPVAPPPPADTTNSNKRILEPYDGGTLKPGKVADPVAYANALADGTIREIAHPDDAADPTERVFDVDPAYVYPNDTTGTRWVKVELQRYRGNIGAVEEINDDATLPLLIEKLKAELIALSDAATAAANESPSIENDAAAADEPAPAVTMEDVLSALAAGDASAGRVVRTPEPKLTRPQAELQHRIYRVLTDRGVSIKRQDGVYGWLLDQIAAAVKGDE